MRRAIIFTTAFVAVIFMPASATIINIPDDYETIQEGIDASSDGDTVRVVSGTYVENIDFSGKNIVVGSWFLDDGDPSYISSTIIDGNATDAVVKFENSETNDARIAGFTIQNGHASFGGGISCSNSSPTISNNTISGNSATWDGGGVFCDYSHPTISNNTISGNSAAWDGGGIFCDYSDPTISNNTIIENSADDGGGISCFQSSPTISNNTISGNSANQGGGITCYESSPTISNNTISGNPTQYFGGGIYCYDSSPTISNNTISGNTAGLYGGGIFSWDSSPVITNTIFWADSAPTDPEIHLYGTSSPVITYCDVEGGWSGEGNIDIDPLFRDPENGDFYLQSITNLDCDGPGDSPCIDAGDPSICDLVLDCDHGLGEIRSDIGAYGGGIDCSEIPTLSEWGMLLMGLLLLAFGTVAVVRRRRGALSKGY
ncbi:MAG: right-handed parallel beta-helix repeat-containing protein [candidate division Zixibacteria bacterium]